MLFRSLDAASVINKGSGIANGDVDGYGLVADQSPLGGVDPVGVDGWMGTCLPGAELTTGLETGGQVWDDTDIVHAVPAEGPDQDPGFFEGMMEGTAI